MGQPHTKSIKDENTWLYIERTKTRGKMTKLGRNILLNNNVLVIRFNSYGILEEKILYNKSDMNSYEFAKKLTENPSKVNKKDIELLRSYSLSDKDISQIVQIIAYFNYINRVADGLGLEPEEFIDEKGYKTK